MAASADVRPAPERDGDGDGDADTQHTIIGILSIITMIVTAYPGCEYYNCLYAVNVS